jgi:hypothetical protein
VIIAFDPGRNIGVAYVSEAGELLQRAIVDLGAVKSLELPAEATLVIGNGTGSRALQDVFARLGRAYALVPERDTSLEGRELYFRHHPPKGLTRLWPKGLRAPPVPVDDYAAYAIRYLAGLAPRRQAG